jgi:iron complex outermembrane receptor protein
VAAARLSHPSIVSIYGNTDGFTVTDAAGANARRYAPVRPESNKTWEYGYKGVLAGKLFLDATYFTSRYENFLSPLTIIANPFAAAAAGGPTFASPTANPNGIPVNAQGRVVNAAGVTPLTLIYYNLGRARVHGTDIGANYYALPGLELRGTLSTVKLRNTDVTGEATSLNSPSTKWTLGASATRLGPVSAGLTYRNVNKYYFRSGVNSGVIPSFGTVDLTLSSRVPGVQSALLNLSVSNLYSCTSENQSYMTPEALAGRPAPAPNRILVNKNRRCGFDRKHIEMVNMPFIGTMAFLGLRVQR